MSLTIEQIIAALPVIITIASAFAVCGWRITDLTRRVEKLESDNQDNGKLVAKIETKLDNAAELLKRIAEKLKVD